MNSPMNATVEIEKALKENPEEAWFTISRKKLESLLAERKLLRDALVAREKHDLFDCPHYPEDQCKCGAIERDLWHVAMDLKEQALTAKPEAK